MLYRKMSDTIEEILNSDSDRILVIDGARQVGKTYTIRDVCSRLFDNYIELNMADDSRGRRLFQDVSSVSDFITRVASLHGDKMGTRDDTIIFIDEIQEYPELLTLLKFLREDGRFRYIASGSLLGISLRRTTSIPIGSIETISMYPMDFEEFLIANGFDKGLWQDIGKGLMDGMSLSDQMHRRIMALFRMYLLIGGLPAAVEEYVRSGNIYNVRRIHKDICDMYVTDASKYDGKNRLFIQRIYSLIQSNMENRKKRVVLKDVEGKKGVRFESYLEEFEYLIHSGIALEVRAVSNPSFPLAEYSTKNLLKLYYNDVGILTHLLYGTNVDAVLNDVQSINLGSVYETLVAQELKSHGFKLFYYDNKAKGEVDYLINDYDTSSIVPLEVKSGRDYKIHSALNRFVSNPDYNVRKAYVLSNVPDVKSESGVTYVPIYLVSFLRPNQGRSDDAIDLRSLIPNP